MVCINSATGKADGFGELKGGYIIDVTLAYARMLFYEGGPVLKALGELISFEIAIGLNGKIWINADDILSTWKVAKCVEHGQFWHVNEAADKVAAIVSSS